ncbi:ion channel [Streptomyces sp. LaPpAH-108]|uniref:ion channel n=1 Tax=Streptomyces sp. LaPpAH-108 TaxID=1155714 RepID=UPI000363C8FD|nr:ion channel [Streptomyces sp. LaPpAH-108]
MNPLAAGLVTAVDLALLMKAAAFIPDNVWLWRNGPGILTHLRHEQTPDVDRVEALGVRCDFCKADIRPRPRTSLRYSRRHPPNRGPASTGVLRGRLRGVVNLVFWTPLLIAGCGTCLILLSPAAPAPLLGLGAAEIGLLGLLTLLAALVIRYSLGTYDLFYSDMGRYVGFFSRRSLAHGSAAQAHSVYLAALLLLSVCCYAVTYHGLYAIRPDQFAGHTSPGFTTWLYFSATIASTTGGSGIYPVGTVSRLVVTVQTATGLILLCWVFGVLASLRRERPTR